VPRPTPVRGLGPQTPVGLAARQILGARLADVLVYEVPLLTNRSADGVHDMRVASRRLRAGLGVFGFLGGLDRAEAEVKRLQDALGEVRDRDVQLAWLAEHGAGHAVAHRLRRELPRHERRLIRAVHRFRTVGVPRLEDRLPALEDERALAGKPVRRALRRRLLQLERRMRRLRKAPDALAAHEVRKTVKKLRYEVELVHPALPRTVDAITELLRPFQELLGELHDHDVRLGLLEAGELHQKVSEERAALMAQTARELLRWKTEDVPGTIRALIERATES
jgi:CHAD domain-containing protein